MKKMQTPNVVKHFSMTALAAGFVFAFLPITADASEFGSEKLSDGTEHEEHVELLQELLVEEEYLEDESINGVFDETTEEAVTVFQEDASLLIDGIAGPQTLGALSVLEKDDENVLVEYLQEDLKSFGYYGGSIDGIFGPLTEDAVKGFQSDAGIHADGLAGPATYSAMMNFTAPQPETTVESEPANEAASEDATETTEEATASAETTSESTSSAPEGTTISMEATAYTAYCNGCSGITATGIDLRNDPHANVVAVDPNIIPLGSRVYVEGYGEAIAGDTGGAINGHKIDLHMATKDEALNFGRQQVNVTILN
ncbi:peptidoglycan-binding protein [Geomicrobium sp. JCM 19039]|uniref:peptidoglycan-binding protein n=1 Tax=Geomicrobium sp. JCM 19039 TaxID=1460636 RepID=UPI00045F488E|nr:peptidoglycan-binding protein [Geomicrobium sp. JCM 19039]GAK13431.1 cell wall-binding protein [Geomicrobium sp. JCM 19039]